MHYQSWCALSEEELAARDVAEVNLAAAFNLPGVGRLDVAAYRRKLDDWASLVERTTREHLPGYRHIGSDYTPTEGHFRMLALVTVLQRDLGVDYNHAFLSGRYSPLDARDLFIHGPLSGHGGTCATLPVLYAAVGQRLKYPLRLALAREHVYLRWEGPKGDGFNIEATARGFLARPDGHFRTWPKPLTDRHLASGMSLRSLSHRERLAWTLKNRGTCALYHLDTWEAVGAHGHAAKIWPVYQDLWAVSTIIHRAVVKFNEHIATGYHVEPGAFPRIVDSPREEWERHYYPYAEAKLEEIRLVRQEAMRSVATAQVFADMNSVACLTK